MLHLGVEVTLLERRASVFQTRVLARDETMFTKNACGLQGKKLRAGKDGQSAASAASGADHSASGRKGGAGFIGGEEPASAPTAVLA